MPPSPRCGLARPDGANRASTRHDLWSTPAAPKKPLGQPPACRAAVGFTGPLPHVVCQRPGHQPGPLHRSSRQGHEIRAGALGVGRIDVVAGRAGAHEHPGGGQRLEVRHEAIAALEGPRARVLGTVVLKVAVVRAQGAPSARRSKAGANHEDPPARPWRGRAFPFRTYSRIAGARTTSKRRRRPPRVPQPRDPSRQRS